MKKLLLAVPVALAIGMFTMPAFAGTNVGIAIGEPYPVYDSYPGYHPYPQPNYGDDDDDEDEQDQISCWEGKQIVQNPGFRRVSPVRCEGSIFRYQALKSGRPWIVRVDSYSARIVSARRLRY